MKWIEIARHEEEPGRQPVILYRLDNGEMRSHQATFRVEYGGYVYTDLTEKEAKSHYSDCIFHMLGVVRKLWM